MKHPTSRKSAELLIMFILSLSFTSGVLHAQEFSAKAVTFGLILGDPLGATMKYRIGTANALDISFGPDYFGSPRLQIDYIWEFDTFHSNVVRTYVGPGLAVALAKGIKIFFSREPHHESFAELEDNKFGFGGRAIFGLDIMPIRSPIQLFVEAGPLIGINHIFDLDLDGAIGFRYRL